MKKSYIYQFFALLFMVGAVIMLADNLLRDNVLGATIDVILIAANIYLFIQNGINRIRYDV